MHVLASLQFHSFQWEDYADRCLKAAKVLQKLLALSLGLDRDFFDQDGYFDKPTCLLGVNRYKFPTHMKNGDPIPKEIYQRWIEGDPLGIRPHLDSGIFTFLLTNGVQGLERCVNNQVKYFGFFKSFGLAYIHSTRLTIVASDVDREHRQPSACQFLFISTVSDFDCFVKFSFKILPYLILEVLKWS